MQANTGQGQNNQGGNTTQGQKSSLSWSQPSMPQSTTPVVPPVVTHTSHNSAVSLMPQKSHTGTYVGILVVGIIIGALIGWAVTNSHQNGSMTSSTSTSTMAMSDTSTSTSSSSVSLSGSNVGSDTSMMGTPPAFTITSPQTAGFAVVVTNVMVSEPTWVVIYEDNAGIQGNALGASLFLPQSEGTAQNGTVQLLRATLPGQSYLAGESIDNGDKMFSLTTDKPVVNAQGKPMLTQFIAQ